MSGTSENSLHQLAKSDEQVRIDNATALITYVGFAEFGIATSSPKWKIMKIEKSGSAIPYTTTISYATAYDNYTNIWDDRAILNYYS